MTWLETRDLLRRSFRVRREQRDSMLLVFGGGGGALTLRVNHGALGARLTLLVELAAADSAEPGRVVEAARAARCGHVFITDGALYLRHIANLRILDAGDLQELVTALVAGAIRMQRELQIPPSAYCE